MIRVLYIVPLTSITPDSIVFGRVRQEPAPHEVVVLVAGDPAPRTLGSRPRDRVLGSAAELGPFLPLLDHAPTILAAAYDEAGDEARPLSRRLRDGQSGGLLRAQGGLELALGTGPAGEVEVRTQYDPDPVPLTDLLRELGVSSE